MKYTLSAKKSLTVAWKVIGRSSTNSSASIKGVKKLSTQLQENFISLVASLCWEWVCVLFLCSRLWIYSPAPICWKKISKRRNAIPHLLKELRFIANAKKRKICNYSSFLIKSIIHPPSFQLFNYYWLYPGIKISGYYFSQST